MIGCVYQISCLCSYFWCLFRKEHMWHVQKRAMGFPKILHELLFSSRHYTFDWNYWCNRRGKLGFPWTMMELRKLCRNAWKMTNRGRFEGANGLVLERKCTETNFKNIDNHFMKRKAKNRPKSKSVERKKRIPHTHGHHLSKSFHGVDGAMPSGLPVTYYFRGVTPFNPASS